MTLYLKYRPQTINELDLKEVRETIEKLVKTKKIPHAFLFSGPKGTGKTSAGRILAKAVNCENPKKYGEPCNKCSQCTSIAKGDNLDVIELDAASHRGIDDVRALRDAVKLSPARANKKVYIIDEAHMLTTEASNALLKTLEEPPEHVIFILATTNPEKLIETVRSRSVRINFSKATTEEIKRCLKRVVKGEKLSADNETLEEIAKASEGSFRDAIKNLEHLATGKRKIIASDVRKLIFAEDAFDVDEFFTHLSEGDQKSAIEDIERASGSGASARNLLRQIFLRLREALLVKVGFPGNALDGFEKPDIVRLINLLEDASQKIPTSVIEHLPIEIAIIEYCEEKGKVVKTRDKNSNQSKKKQIKAKKTSKSSDKKKTNHLNGMDESYWTNVLGKIRGLSTSTEALLRAAKPVNFDGNVLTLGVYYKFHKEKLESDPHRSTLEEAIATLVGNKIRVTCTLTEPKAKSKAKKENGEKSKSASQKSEVVLTESEDGDIIKIAEEIFGS